MSSAEKGVQPSESDVEVPISPDVVRVLLCAYHGCIDCHFRPEV